jgi:hypothetical protein
MIDLDLDDGVTRLDFSVTYPYPAPAVFEAITDFPAYPWWRPNVGVRATGALPCGPGSHLELDGVPRMAEHLVKTELGQQVRRFFDTLGAVVAGRPAATPAG